MLAQRIATAAVLLAILLPTLFLMPPVAFGLVSLAFLTVGAHEWLLLLGRRPIAWPAALGLLLVGGGLLAWRDGHAWPPGVVPAVTGALTLFWCIGGALRLRRADARGGGWPVALLLLLGCWAAMYELRVLGVLPLLSAMAVVWVADVAAYFVGRAFGRRKLAPSISPGKSWEGAIGGFAFVTACGLAAATWPSLGQSLPAQLVARGSPLVAAVLLVGLAALSIVGDLHESLLKRQAGVKDSGTLLPGHGGVLDRIDALVPVMPAALLMFEMMRR